MAAIHLLTGHLWVLQSSNVVGQVDGSGDEQNEIFCLVPPPQDLLHSVHFPKAMPFTVDNDISYDRRGSYLVIMDLVNCEEPQ